MKNVVITGSSSGFGESAAKVFADSGYRVWATMRDTSQRMGARESPSCKKINLKELLNISIHGRYAKYGNSVKAFNIFFHILLWMCLKG